MFLSCLGTSIPTTASTREENPCKVITFSLLTFNCFGLWLPGTKRRLLALSRQLEQSPYQIVCLQEIQLHQYQEMLVHKCSSFPHSYSERYIHCPKGGLLTLSRIPFESQSFEPYQERGLWYTPMLLDRLFYKGMLITKLLLNNIPITIINTHILANFAGDWTRGGMYARLEEKQVEQLAKTVQVQSMDSLILVVGDFNIPRASQLYRDFLIHSGLTDPLAGDPRPTLRVPARLSPYYPLAVDYTFVRLPNKPGLDVQCDLCLSSKYSTSEKHQAYLSDHQGIEIQITTV